MPLALEQAGASAKGATLYVTLEPCANRSRRGPACADLIAGSPLARVVAGCLDPDERTAGEGLARIGRAGFGRNRTAAVSDRDLLAERGTTMEQSRSWRFSN